MPPDERLRASVTAECPNVERLTVAIAGDGAVRGAVVVGRNVDTSDVARRIAETHGIAIPDAAIAAITPEGWKLMERLRDLGVIRFCSDAVKDVLVREAPDLRKQEEVRRRAVVEKAFADVSRQLDMGDLLVNGGFAV